MTTETPMGRGPGIHEMTMAEYIAHPAVGRTAMLAALVTPARARASTMFDFGPSADMLLGTATHTCIYEKDKIPLQFSIWKGKDADGKTQIRRGQKWETFRKAAEIAGRDPNLTEVQYAHALSMAEAIREHEIAGHLLARQPSRRELVIIYKDKPTGLLVKVRIDQLIRDDCPTVMDLKTAKSIEDRQFTHAIMDRGYDIQSALYVDACLAEDIGMINFVIAAVEKDKTVPHADGKRLTHAVRVFEMDVWLAGGRMRARTALDLIASCKKANKWPSYPMQVERLDPPTYYTRQWGGRRHG